MKNYHILSVKYLGPTNTQGSRVRIKSERFNQSVIIPYDYSSSRIYEMAEKWLLERGFDIVGVGETPNGYILISDTFEPLK